MKCISTNAHSVVVFYMFMYLEFSRKKSPKFDYNLKIVRDTIAVSTPKWPHLFYKNSKGFSETSLLLLSI